MRRRPLLAIASVLAAERCLPSGARAGTPDWPSALNNLRFIVPTLAGGTLDLIARSVAGRLGQSHQLAVAVLDIEGAAGEIALRRLLNEPPDGRTWLLAQESLITINPSFYPRSSSDALEGLVPVALVATSSFYLLARAEDGPASMQEFLQEARSAALPLPYGSGGVGTLHHLSMEGLAANLNLKMLHVPYKGNSQAVQALVRGEIRLLPAGSSALPLVESGRLKMLAVTSPRRLPAYPEVPALSEFVPGLQPANWFAFFGRKGIPDAVVQAMRELLRLALENEELRRSIKERGNVDAGFLAGRAFTDLILADRQRYADISQRLALPRPQ